jgi:chromate transporter
MSIHLTPAQWLEYFLHFITLSLLAVGGAIATLPDMHRFLVVDKGWLGESQFATSIALGQVAPGPNVLLVALIGWNVGLNAGGYALAALGMALALGGIMLPSTILTHLAAQWAHRNREMRAVRAFKQGMGPVVVALLVATGWLLMLAAGAGQPARWHVWLAAGVTAVLVWRTRIHLLWLLGAGAVLGALGWL